MNLAPGSVTAITAAQAGWTVAIDWLDDKDVEILPIAAWAAVVQPEQWSDRPRTSVEPVFVHQGTLYSESEFRNDMNIAVRGQAKVAIEVIAPRSEAPTTTAEAAP